VPSSAARAGLAVAVLLAVTACGQPAPPPAVVEAPSGVACLGRIEPENGVMVIGARSISGQPSIVARLLVNEGDAIAQGQILAVLNSRDELAAAASQTEARIALAQARLAQIKAGAKPADLAAQHAEVQRLEREFENAQRDYEREQRLLEAGATTQAAVDTRRLGFESGTQLLAQARSRLASLSEFRAVDVEVAERELAVAEAEAARARAALDQAVVRSPVAGRVLEVRAWPGEEVGPGGILEIGRTDQMYVIAEVPEADVARVATGQRATITAGSLAKPLTGIVDRLGSKVTKNPTMPVDPASFADGRIVEARIKLDDSATASRLINAQVQVVIRP